MTTVSGVEGAIYAPIRRFDETALVLPSGRSLIGELMTMADKILVEDWDLTARRLQEHINLFGLKDLSVTDLTDRRGGRWGFGGRNRQTASADEVPYNKRGDGHERSCGRAAEVTGGKE